MLKLFERTQIKSLSLKNRYVFSATWDGLADDNGFCTARNREILVERARGGVGLLVTGMAFVRPEGRGAPWQLAIHGDEFIPGLAEMTAEARPETCAYCNGCLVSAVKGEGLKCILESK